jgi:hypothetical protein
MVFSPLFCTNNKNRYFEEKKVSESFGECSLKDSARNDENQL